MLLMRMMKNLMRMMKNLLMLMRRTNGRKLRRRRRRRRRKGAMLAICHQLPFKLAYLWSGSRSGCMQSNQLVHHVFPVAVHFAAGPSRDCASGWWRRLVGERIVQRCSPPIGLNISEVCGAGRDMVLVLNRLLFQWHDGQMTLLLLLLLL